MSSSPVDQTGRPPIALYSAAWGLRITALVCIALSIYFGNMALDFPAGGGTFPLFAASGTFFLAILMIITSFVKAKQLTATIYLDLSYNKLKPPILIILSILYITAIIEIGYFVSSIAFLFITTYAVGIRNIKAVALTALILFPTMYGFFVVLLQAQLPQGILF